MSNNFSPKLNITTVLVSSAIFVTGCATEPFTEGSLRPVYRSSGNTNIESRAFYDEGRQHFANKRYGLALEAFRSELKYNGKSVNALNGVAACYDKLGRYDLSARYYYQALDIDPHSVRTLSNLGYSYLLQKRDAEAIQVLNLALSKDPDNKFIRQNLALASGSAEIPATKIAAVTTQEHDQQESDTTVKGEAARAGEGRQDARNVVSTSTTADDAGSSDQVKQPGMTGTDTKPVILAAKNAGKPGDANSADQDTANAPVRAEKPAALPAQETLNKPTVDIAVSGFLPSIDISIQAENTENRSSGPGMVDNTAGQHADIDAAKQQVAVSRADLETSKLLSTGMILDEVHSPDVADISTGSAGVADNVVATPAVTVMAEAEVTGEELFPVIDISHEDPETAGNNFWQSVFLIDEAEPHDSAIATVDVDKALAEAEIVSIETGIAGNDNTNNQSSPGHDLENSIEVSNGNGRNGMARQLGNYLSAHGNNVTRVTNASSFDYSNSVIYYKDGKHAVAQQVAAQFPVQLKLEQTTRNRGDIDVRIVLGMDMMRFATASDGTLYAWNTIRNSVPVSAAVEISNGNGRNGMARLLKGVLASRGDSVKRITNADNFDYEKTVIFYSTGSYEDAKKLADRLPVKVTLKETDGNRGDIDLRVVLGKDFLTYEVAMRRILAANA